MTQEQFEKLNKSCYLKYSIDETCHQETISARNLLCSARFDFYAILIYIDHKVRGVSDLSWAKKIYKERTMAMTGNKLSEPGNENKNNFDDFINVLDKLIYDFQTGNYDYNRTLIPVDKDYIPLDGAHRIACAAYFNEKIKVLCFPNREYLFKGFNYLKKELLPISIADYMAIESTRWHEDLYVFFLWPQAHKYTEKLKKAQEIIYASVDVMYDVEYKFTYEAIRNIMLQIYGHMDWLGNIDNNFVNVYKKVDEVWASNGKVQLIITKGKSCEYITKIKTEIREMFGIGLASCHSTDNIRETRLAINAILNPQSRHFLERATPTKFKEAYKLLERFKNILKGNELDFNDFIIDSSMVLALYGARNANDLDFYSISNKDISIIKNEKDIEEHDKSQELYYEFPIKDYIISPEHHFYYNELKIISLHDLLKFKQNRYSKTKDAKDIRDIGLIKNYYKDINTFLSQITSFKYNYLRLQRSCYNYIYALIFWRRREILEKIGLYKPLKALKSLFYK